MAELTESSPGDWLLHGDLEHSNILKDRRRGWTAIDPKGVIGDKAIQAARFFGNPNREFLLHWAFVDSIPGACWCIADHENEKVASAETPAGILSPMIDI